jgi:2-hydroxychromene-2-carboxylate isomerase
VFPRSAAPGHFEFFFDYSSPYTYLASTQVQALAARAGAEARYRPMLLGGLFKAIGTPMVPVATFSEPKRRYIAQDLVDSAAYLGVPFRWSSRFPIRTVAPLRLTIAAGTPPSLVDAIFHACWAEDRDISSPEVLRAILDEVGLDPGLLDRAQEPEIKQALTTATSEAVAAGVCGAPSFLVRSHLFWGQDRLDLVEKTLAGWEPPTDIDPRVVVWQTPTP